MAPARACKGPRAGFPRALVCLQPLSEKAVSVAVWAVWKRYRIVIDVELGQTGHTTHTAPVISFAN